MAVVTLPGREVDIFDRQRLHVGENRRLHRLEGVVRAVPVVMARLIALKPTRVNGSNASPARLLRAPAEQAAEFTHVELLFPPTERGVIGRVVDVEFVADRFRVVEPRFALSKALVEFSPQEDQRDLYPLGEPAVAVRRSGFVWIIYMPFGKILTLPYQRSFGPHTA